jgi:hypothetical protein
MGKLNQNFTTWKGNYRTINFLIEDVVSLVGATVKWAISVDEESSKLIEKTSTGGGITIDGQTATVILDETDTDYSSGITAGDYYHELRVVDTDGHVSTPAIGTMTLKDVIIQS